MLYIGRRARPIRILQMWVLYPSRQRRHQFRNICRQMWVECVPCQIWSFQDKYRFAFGFPHLSSSQKIWLLSLQTDRIKRDDRNSIFRDIQFLECRFYLRCFGDSTSREVNSILVKNVFDTQVFYLWERRCQICCWDNLSRHVFTFFIYWFVILDERFGCRDCSWILHFFHEARFFFWQCVA